MGGNDILETATLFGNPSAAEHLVKATDCLGAFCPNQSNSMGETEGVAAIEATASECNRVAGCLLESVQLKGVSNAS